MNGRYMEYEGEDYFGQETAGQSASVDGKHYEWQLSDGRRWLRVDNDHVIETHYCQPGAKGMTINTPSLGQLYLDFDKIETQQGATGVQRLTFLPQGQTEDIGWYFRDDKLWREYGSQGTGRAVSSVSGTDVEQQYSLNPQGSFSFTVGSTTYTLDFSAMTQINHVTGVVRNVRRRPKINSIISTTGSVSMTTLNTAVSSSQLSTADHMWEFMGEEGEWTEYQAHMCSFDSTAIERHYQQNPQGQLHFKVKRFTYTLDFSGMCQINDSIGTRRAVKRTAVCGSQQRRSAGPRWQFQDVDGAWKDYSKRRGRCSVSSQDIEIQYQQNPTGTMRFTTRSFNYDLDFSAMTQRNLSTNTTRRVQRLS